MFISSVNIYQTQNLNRVYNILANRDILNGESCMWIIPSLFIFFGSGGSGKMYACAAMYSHFKKRHYITRTFLICPTKAPNDIFKNLKKLNKKKNVCDAVTRDMQSALSNILREVRMDWAKYEEDLLYQKVHNKYGKHQKPMALKYACILESRQYAFPTQPYMSEYKPVWNSNAKDTYCESYGYQAQIYSPSNICFLVQSGQVYFE